MPMIVVPRWRTPQSYERFPTALDLAETRYPQALFEALRYLGFAPSEATRLSLGLP